MELGTILKNNRELKVTENFTLGELLEGRLEVFGANHDEFKKYVYKYITLDDLKNVMYLAKEFLQPIRENFGITYVNCTFRPREWELKQGRGGLSQHVLGKAADIKCKNFSAKELYDWINKKTPNVGLGLYETWVHIDDRGSHARW